MSASDLPVAGDGGGTLAYCDETAFSGSGTVVQEALAQSGDVADASLSGLPKFGRKCRSRTTSQPELPAQGAIDSTSALAAFTEYNAPPPSSPVSSHSVSAAEFRDAVIDFARMRQDGEKDHELWVTSNVLLEQVMALDEDQLNTWLSALPDPERYIELLRSPPKELVKPTSEPGKSVARLDASTITAPNSASGDLDSRPYRPAYPGGTDAWFNAMITPLSIINYLGVEEEPDARRCLFEPWSERYERWVNTKTASNVLEVACLVAGCDPTGIGCAAACLPYAGFIGS